MVPSLGPLQQSADRRHLVSVEPTRQTDNSEPALAPGMARPSLRLPGTPPTQPTDSSGWPIARQAAPPCAFPGPCIHEQEAALCATCMWPTHYRGKFW